MSHYLDQKTKTWVVQIQRKAPDGTKIRLCHRIRGSKADAQKADIEMAKEAEKEFQSRAQIHHMKEERKKAEAILGITPSTTKNPSPVPVLAPTLREFLTGRWARHAAVVQGATTLRTTRSHVAYLCHYLGDQPLGKIDQAAVAKLRENLLHDGPRSFISRRDGESRKPRMTEFTKTSVNRIMATLSAALRLAEREKIIDKAPHVDMLPRDESQPIYPPTDEGLSAILKTAAEFSDIAPFMVDAVILATETGMRAGELFTRTWSSADFKMGETGAIRVERAPKTKMVDGKAWKPKHQKARIIPLTPRALDTLLSLRERVPNGPNDLIIPSRGGCPYVRLEAAPDRSGIGYFPSVVQAAGITSHVRWHDLRHYFAVRALLRGVPIAVVSAWLGHSDVNLTVKRYGRWAAEAKEQWQWAKRMSGPLDAITQRPALTVLDGGQRAQP
jgi:integrase